MKKNIVTIDNEYLEVKKRKHNFFELIEILFVLLLPLGTAFGTYYFFFLTGWSKIWNIPEDKAFIWILIDAGILSILRFIGEFSFKNSFLNKQLLKCGIFSFFCGTMTSAFLWLIQHIFKNDLAILPVLTEAFLYFILISIIRIILRRIDNHKKQRVLIIADKNEAIDYAVKFIRFGNKKDSIRALFVDIPSCNDEFIKAEIDKCDVIYFGKCVPSHTKNVLTAYVTANQKKQAYVVPNS